MSSPPPRQSSDPLPPFTSPFLRHMKANRGHAGLIPAADMNFWSMAWCLWRAFSNTAPLASLPAPDGNLPLPCSLPFPTPPLSSHSKDWATPNVNDVSLAIVHGWPHLNGWLVPRPAPYNGLLSHSDLFSAFFPPPWREGSLSLSLSLWLS